MKMSRIETATVAVAAAVSGPHAEIHKIDPSLTAANFLGPSRGPDIWIFSMVKWARVRLLGEHGMTARRSFQASLKHKLEASFLGR